MTDDCSDDTKNFWTWTRQQNGLLGTLIYARKDYTEKNNYMNLIICI